MQEKVRHYRCCMMLLLLSTAEASAEVVDNLLSLSLEELSEIRVSIATGTPKSITGAPAGTTLITANDIYIMGAQTLDEALQTVPSLYISRASVNNAPRYFFRGVASRYNPQALLLVNGVPMRGLFLGDRSQHLPNQYSMPAKFIERIEIIRGPGSALYGADAFAGVINVITSGPDDLDDTQVSIAGGSFDTLRASLKQPLQAGEAKGVLLLSYQSTQGDSDAIVTSDLQTNIDTMRPPSIPAASEAPGPTETSLKVYDIRVDVGWEKLRFRAGTTRAWDIGGGTGISDALDAAGRYVHDLDNLDLTWTEKNWIPDLRLEAKLSYLHSHFRSSPITQLFPPGAFFGSFPDGVLSEYSVAEENAEASLIGIYSGFSDHRLTLGTGFYWGDLYKTTGYNNSQLLPNGFLVPRPTFVETADTDAIFLPEEQRTNCYFLLQDEWQFAPSWELTTGLRFDDYDDVGSTVNPRLALVWSASDSWTSKLMYSEAFRVPSFSELWVTSNPSGLGNPDLEPEKLRSTEIVFIWQPENRITTTLNLYHFYIQDYIDFVANDSNGANAENIGRLEGLGAELELRYLISSDWSMLTNYSYQQTEHASSHEDLGLAPKQMAFLQVNWTPANWIISPQLTLIGERLRQPGDIRAPLDGYVVFDISARRQWGKRYSIGLIGRNVLDADIREPSPGPSVNTSLPALINDIPQQGPSLTLEFNADF